MDLSGVFVFWYLMDADVDTQTNILRTFCSICQNHVEVQMKIPECCFQRRIVFIALPLFGEWKKCISEPNVHLINAKMHCVNLLHHHMLIMSIVCLAAAPLFCTFLLSLSVCHRPHCNSPNAWFQSSLT